MQTGQVSFPDPVNETSARVVAAGVVAMAGTAVLLDQPWLMLPLAYGFAARVAAGPTYSPLGQLATRVVTPRLPGPHRMVPGPPKRLAQAVGLTFSAGALALHYGGGRPRAAKALLAGLITAATLESAFGICLACRAFPLLARAGLVPESVCPDCNDVLRRLEQPATLA